MFWLVSRDGNSYVRKLTGKETRMHETPQARNSQVGYSQVRKLTCTQTRKHKNSQVRKLASEEICTGRGNAVVRKLADDH